MFGCDCAASRRASNAAAAVFDCEKMNMIHLQLSSKPTRTVPSIFTLSRAICDSNPIAVAAP